jgi:hypothetical protein
MHRNVSLGRPREANTSVPNDENAFRGRTRCLPTGSVIAAETFRSKPKEVAMIERCSFAMGAAMVLALACAQTNARPPQDPQAASAGMATESSPAPGSAPVATTPETRATTPEARSPAPATSSTPETRGTAPQGQTASGKAPPSPSTGDSPPRTDVQPDDSRAAEADNTRRNERDRGESLTPMSQGSSRKETEITADIRKKIVGDDSLSFTAKNVKVITVGSKVTLRGPVKNDHERTAIESAARQTPGVTEVDNQLEVK